MRSAGIGYVVAGVADRGSGCGAVDAVGGSSSGCSVVDGGAGRIRVVGDGFGEVDDSGSDRGGSDFIASCVDGDGGGINKVSPEAAMSVAAEISPRDYSATAGMPGD